jgi:hypothetical protein
LQIVGDGLILIESNRAGVGADEAFVENAPGQLGELVFFERLKHARADLGRRRNLVESDFALLALKLQFFPEGWQVSGSRFRRTENGILL